MLLACTDAPTPPTAPEPSLGSLAIRASTSGTDIGQDGYQVFLDGSFVQSIGPNDAIQRSGVPEGRHAVKISGFLPNCWVLGANELEVAVPASGNAEARFELACTTPNTFVVTTRTVVTGRQAPDSLPGTVYYYDGGRYCLSYFVCQDRAVNPSGERISLPANGALQLPVHALKVQVSLSLPQNCAAWGGSSQKAETRQNGVVRFSFDITCN